jgi:hypothetical protein
MYPPWHPAGECWAGLMAVGSRRECTCSLGAAAAPDLGKTLLFTFFWVRSLNSGDLEYLQIKIPVFNANQKKKSFMLYPAFISRTSEEYMHGNQNKNYLSEHREQHFNWWRYHKALVN